MAFMAAREFLDARIARALSHPIRQGILVVLADRGEASPKEIAKELDEPLDVVSYHARILRDAGHIELVRTEPRRGAVEHYYRAVLQPVLYDAQWESIPVALRRQIAGHTLGQILKAASTAGQEGGFDQPGAHVDRVPLRLDDQGWAKLSELVLRLLEEVMALQDESDARRRESASKAELRPSELAILHYAVEESGRGRGAQTKNRESGKP
jgi:DNA-binding transcriptional ArsR family regulator